MKLQIDPPVSPAMFQESLELVICIVDAGMPEIYVEPGLPKPDRHLMLGIMQTVALAVAEKDDELVAFTDSVSILLERDGTVKELEPGLIIVRTKTGKSAIIAVNDKIRARTLAREGVRWFTGTIRLDIP